MIESDFLDGLGPPLVVATHMRSGTHLTMDFVRRQFLSFRSWKWPVEANDMLYLALDVLSVLEANWGEARARRILSRPPRALIKTHWTDPGLLRLREKQPYFADFLEEGARVCACCTPSPESAGVDVGLGCVPKACCRHQA
jgi:hypothetical protein